MFGHLYPTAQQNQDEQHYQRYRRHYCGTCKTIGKRYGQPLRAALNFDVVFLSELLSDLSGEDTNQWQSAFQKINKCLSLPDTTQAIPRSLEYAAAVNVLLAELKMQDNIQDGASRLWRWLHRWGNRKFRRAEQGLEQLGADLSDFHYWKEQQPSREINRSFDDLASALAFAAEPTARLTAWAYTQGAICVKNTDNIEVLKQIGFAFGELVYVLDAWQDIPKDLAQAQFNPLVLFWKLKSDASRNQQQEVLDFLQSRCEAISLLLAQLPLPEAALEVYSARLSSNILAKLTPRPAPAPRLGLRQRWANRWAMAKEKAAALVCTPSGVWSNLRYYMLSIAVFVAPQAVENLDSEAKAGVLGWWAAFTGALAAVGAGAAWGRQRRKKGKLKAKAKDCKDACKVAGNACGWIIFTILCGVAFLVFLIFGIIFLATGLTTAGIVMMCLLAAVIITWILVSIFACDNAFDGF